MVKTGHKLNVLHIRMYVPCMCLCMSVHLDLRVHTHA